VDASYTGDLLPAAGVSYTIGRESPAQYGESLNGVRSPNSDFTNLTLDPYLTPGNPASGLLPLIQTNSPGLPGTADGRLQAYSFRLCLTTTATNKIPITAPTNYDASQFELLGRYSQALVVQGTSPSLQTFITIESMPKSKTDINNAGALSIDFVGESRAYVEADPATRAQIWQAHKNYTQGFLYFLATDPRIPAGVRSAMSSYGYAKDEFVDNGGWPWELYVREARRMVSDYVMTQSNVFGLLPVPDSIGMAGYFTDSHYCQRVVVNGGVRNEGSARGDITQPYPIAYRALVPKTNECVNLLVPWALSASHTAFSSLRMEPVFMILGQAAGTAACFAIDEATAVQTINIAKLQAQLVADNQEIGLTSNPGVIVDNADATGVSTNGSWTSSTATAGYYGADYWHDSNTNKGASTVTFTPTLPVAGLYQVYARWTAYGNRATNVPVDIISPAGTTTVIVDETQQGGQWVPLLVTNFNAGTSGKVRVRTTGTTGFVVADAVQFVPAALPVVNLWTEDAQASRWGRRTGSIIISRSGGTNLPLRVGLSYSGTAKNGLDFQTVPSSITFPAGVVWTNLTILPFTNAQPVGTKSLNIAFAADSNYTAGGLNFATVTISDVPIFDWRLQYFGANAANPAIAGDAAAPAGDGIPNLVKYALGLNPTQSATNPLITATITTTGYFQASYLRHDPPPLDIIYRVEGAPDLARWVTNGILTSEIRYQSNGTAMVICHPARNVGSDPQQFLRLTITRY
jgi:hypothetical protein